MTTMYQQATTSSKIDERSPQILRRMYSTLETRAPDKEDYLICKATGRN